MVFRYMESSRQPFSAFITVGGGGLALGAWDAGWRRRGQVGEAWASDCFVARRARDSLECWGTWWAWCVVLRGGAAGRQHFLEMNLSATRLDGGDVTPIN